MNKVILIGRVGKDTEALNDKFSVNNLVTTKSWVNDKGEKVEKSHWHKVLFTGKQALTASEYIKKGIKLGIEGELQNSEWVDKEGVKRFSTEVLVQSFEFLEPKKS